MVVINEIVVEVIEVVADGVVIDKDVVVGGFFVNTIGR